MARRSYVLAGDVADSQQQLSVNTVQTLTLEPSCSAVLLSARGPNTVNVTFDNSTPSVTNGVGIAPGSQPLLLPVGYHAHAAHNLKAIGTSSFLDVVQIGKPR